MKKFLISAALVAAVSLSMSAQEKGDWTVGGVIGVSGGTNTFSQSVSGDNHSEKSTNPTSFEFSPRASYFIIDNLELSAGLDYTLGVEHFSSKSSLSTNIAMFSIGANYYIPIIKDKLYYTPGIQFGFGGGSSIENDGGDKFPTKIPFALGFSADLGKFEFKVLDYLGISMNVFALDVLYNTIDTEMNEVKANMTTFAAGFNYGMSVGVKYYF